MPQVEAVLTPATAGQVIGALLGTGLSRSEANLVAAQSAVETGGWRYMRNWNVGNITTGSNAGPWMIQSATNSLHFIAYPSLAAGAAGMVSWLRSHNIPLDTTVANYVTALKNVNYFGSGDAAAYQRNIQSYLPQMQAAVPVLEWDLPTKLVVGISVAVMAYGSLVGLRGVRWVPRSVRRVGEYLPP